MTHSHPRVAEESCLTCVHHGLVAGHRVEAPQAQPIRNLVCEAYMLDASSAIGPRLVGDLLRSRDS